jgi:hypothetical protein
MENLKQRCEQRRNELLEYRVNFESNGAFNNWLNSLTNLHNVLNRWDEEQTMMTNCLYISLNMKDNIDNSLIDMKNPNEIKKIFDRTGYYLKDKLALEFAKKNILFNMSEDEIQALTKEIEEDDSTIKMKVDGHEIELPTPIVNKFIENNNISADVIDNIKKPVIKTSTIEEKPKRKSRIDSRMKTWTKEENINLKETLKGFIDDPKSFEVIEKYMKIIDKPNKTSDEDIAICNKILSYYTGNLSVAGTSGTDHRPTLKTNPQFTKMMMDGTFNHMDELLIEVYEDFVNNKKTPIGDIEDIPTED